MSKIFAYLSLCLIETTFTFIEDSYRVLRNGKNFTEVINPNEIMNKLNKIKNN